MTTLYKAVVNIGGEIFRKNVDVHGYYDIRGELDQAGIYYDEMDELDDDGNRVMITVIDVLK